MHYPYPVYHNLKAKKADATIVDIEEIRRLAELPNGGLVGFISEIKWETCLSML